MHYTMFLFGICGVLHNMTSFSRTKLHASVAVSMLKPLEVAPGLRVRWGPKTPAQSDGIGRHVMAPKHAFRQRRPFISQRAEEVSALYLTRYPCISLPCVDDC